MQDTTPTQPATVGSQGPTGPATPITSNQPTAQPSAIPIPNQPTQQFSVEPTSNQPTAPVSAVPVPNQPTLSTNPNPTQATQQLSVGAGPTPIVVNVKQPAPITDPNQPAATPLTVHVTQLPTPNQPAATPVMGRSIDITNQPTQFSDTVVPNTNQPTQPASTGIQGQVVLTEPTQTRAPAPIEVTTVGDASKGLEVIPQQGVPSTGFSSGFKPVTATNPNPMPAYSTPPPALVSEYSVMDPNALQSQFGYRPPATQPWMDFNEQQVNTGDSGPNQGALRNQQLKPEGPPASDK